MSGTADSETANPETANPERSDTETVAAATLNEFDPSDWTERKSTACAHCGLPASAATNPAFCCSGCKGAYELIHGWGLDAFYDFRSNAVSDSNRSTDQDSFLMFEDDEFLGESVPQMQVDGLLMTEMTVLGLHCPACTWLIENVATRTPGWANARVRHNDHSIRLVFDQSVIRLGQIARLLNQLGYQLVPKTQLADDGFQLQSRALLVQIAVAGFCAANAMWIAIALYAGDSTGLAESHRAFLRLIGTGLGLASVAFPGRTFFVGALASIKARTPHMDLPVALGLMVGSVAGIVSAISGRGAVYFDSLAVLVFLLLVGRWVQLRQQYRAARSVDLMLRVTPRHARRVESSGETKLVLADRMETGDVIRVIAGDSFPADGLIVHGHSSMDRSLLTGESRPIPVKVGHSVAAGALNIDRSLDIRVTAVGQESRIGKVIQSVEEASSSRTAIVQFADRIGGVFVCVVTILAIGTFLFWLRQGWQLAASNSTALLIVACPCALALATPLAVAVAIGRSARRRIFIRDGNALGQLSKAGTIWFDKTGTLTTGRPIASLVHGDPSGIPIAAVVEKSCNHPIATAIVAAAGHNVTDFASPVGDVQVFPGGVVGTCDDYIVIVGNRDFIASHHVTVDRDFDDAIDLCIASGDSAIVIAIDGIARSVLAIRDDIKSGATRLMRELESKGWKTGILSGDDNRVVATVGDRLGIAKDRCLGGLSPEQKLSIVGKPDNGTTVMVGDGANDAAALAAADVGIAVRGGAEVSLRAAPVFVATGDFDSIGSLFRAARRATALVYTTIGISLAYNLIAVLLASVGRISPLVAAVLMPISSITVLSLCLAWPIFMGGNGRPIANDRGRSG